jgi:hypothetical protein
VDLIDFTLVPSIPISEQDVITYFPEFSSQFVLESSAYNPTDPRLLHQLFRKKQNTAESEK